MPLLTGSSEGLLKSETRQITGALLPVVGLRMLQNHRHGLEQSDRRVQRVAGTRRYQDG